MRPGVEVITFTLDGCRACSELKEMLHKEEEKNEGPLDEDGNPIPRAKPLFFKESDYHLRVPHEKY